MIKQKSVLGSVLYKASILHLQPRQIFLRIKDMSNYCCLCSKHHHSKLYKSQAVSKVDNPTISANTKDLCLLDLPNSDAQFIIPLSSTRDVNSNNSNNTREQPDDVLTLSLSQGDQVQVSMSSLGSLDSTRPGTTSFHADALPATSNAHLDDFLATNKTLKSIQTITKMIVDLSSKADSDCADEQNHLSSPSKLVKLSNESNVGESPRRALASYVPPDTPVHKPRRVASRQLSSDLFRQRQRDAPIVNCSQSANTTPLKSLHDPSATPSGRWRHRRRAARAAESKPTAVMNPLPPPPPAVPIGRRLTYSAKRFIDGSLRSLYGYPTSSDLEPEENEPLVAGSSFAGGLTKQTRYQLMNKRAESQPSTPLSSKPRRHWRDKATKLGFGKNSQTDSEPLSSASSSSDLSSSCDDESAFDGDLELTEPELKGTSLVKLVSKRKGGKFSTSVKNLNELEQVKQAGQARESVRNKRRKLRRKSVCLNSSCCCAKEFKLNNRPPVWNELSQIYQLDFGGRVTQESAKNLQIDFEGNLALQFGRIDRRTYTLDYKYPFNADQAMAIALASLTQRLK